MTNRNRRGLLLAMFLASAAGFAQVSATQPTEEELAASRGEDSSNELCPLQLEIPLGKPTTRSPEKLPAVGSSVLIDTSSFTCDKAVIEEVRVGIDKGRRGKRLLTATLTVSTTWYRQDIHLTTRLMVNDEEVLRERWEDLSIGNTATSGLWGGSSTKTPKAEWWISEEQAEEWFGGEFPTLIVMLEVVE